MTAKSTDRMAEIAAMPLPERLRALRAEAAVLSPSDPRPARRPRASAPPPPEPTREQDQAAEAVASRWGRCAVQPLAGGLIRVLGLVDDVETERTVYDVDGSVVASNRGDDATGRLPTIDPRALSEPPSELACPRCGEDDDRGTCGDTGDRTDANIADWFHCNACGYQARIFPAWDYEAGAALEVRLFCRDCAAPVGSQHREECLRGPSTVVAAHAVPLEVDPSGPARPRVYGDEHDDAGLGGAA